MSVVGPDPVPAVPVPDPREEPAVPVFTSLVLVLVCLPSPFLSSLSYNIDENKS